MICHSMLCFWKWDDISIQIYPNLIWQPGSRISRNHKYNPWNPCIQMMISIRQHFALLRDSGRWSGQPWDPTRIDEGTIDTHELPIVIKSQGIPPKRTATTPLNFEPWPMDSSNICQFSLYIPRKSPSNPMGQASTKFSWMASRAQLYLIRSPATTSLSAFSGCIFSFTHRMYQNTFHPKATLGGTERGFLSISSHLSCFKPPQQPQHLDGSRWVSNGRFEIQDLCK